jgi:hypothetical protein
MNYHSVGMLLLALSVSLSSGCKQAPDSHSFADAPKHPDGSGSADVTYLPSVHVIEQSDGMKALISVSTDGSTLVFDRTLAPIPAMSDGEVILVKGMLARKIVASITNGDEIAVLTAPAGLLDVVSDAKIRVTAPIRFGESQNIASQESWARGWQVLADVVVPPANAQSPVEERRKAAERKGRADAFGNLVQSPYKAVMSGWETAFSVVPAPGRLNLSLFLKKSVSGVAAVVTGNGYLEDFDFASDIDVEHGVVERLQLTYKKLNGVMNFKWEVQTVEAGSLRGNAKMKLPAAIEIPLYQYLGGLPLFLEISSAVIIKPALGAQYEFSRGEFRITYDGYQNFRVKEGVVDADGNVTGDIDLIESNSGSGAPIGMVLAFAAPRIELSLGMSKMLKCDGFKEAAAKADAYLEKLVTKAFGAEALAKFKSSPMSEVTATKIVDTAMASNAAAWIELTTSSGMSHTGTAVMVPCTRNDLHMSVKVGANAKAFGQAVGDADHTIFEKGLTDIRPSENALCDF